MTDLKSMSLIELRKLSAQVHKELDKRAQQSKRVILRKLQQLAAKEGLKPTDFFDTPLSIKQDIKRADRTTRGSPPKPVATKVKLPPIYWNPVNAQQGWSGHGRRPAWILTFIENGGDLESLKKRR